MDRETMAACFAELERRRRDDAVHFLSDDEVADLTPEQVGEQFADYMGQLAIELDVAATVAGLGALVAKEPS